MRLGEATGLSFSAVSGHGVFTVCLGGLLGRGRCVEHGRGSSPAVDAAAPPRAAFCRVPRFLGSPTVSRHALSCVLRGQACGRRGLSHSGTHATYTLNVVPRCPMVLLWFLSRVGSRVLGVCNIMCVWRLRSARGGGGRWCRPPRGRPRPARRPGDSCLGPRLRTGPCPSMALMMMIHVCVNMCTMHACRYYT